MGGLFGAFVANNFDMRGSVAFAFSFQALHGRKGQQRARAAGHSVTEPAALAGGPARSLLQPILHSTWETAGLLNFV